MNTQINLKKSYFLAVAIGAISVTACNNSDTSKTGSDTTATTVMSTDTANAMNTTPASTTDQPAMAGDTSKMSSTATKGTMAGTAKPDPSKKGKKGKVNVTAQTAAANTNMTEDNSGVYNSAEVLPAYPGGSKGLSQFFDDNVQYPEVAMQEGVEGTVNVNFAVDEHGKLSNAKVVGGNLGYGLDEEALRVVNKMPIWTPGKIKGKNVKTYYTLPVSFQLY